MATPEREIFTFTWKIVNFSFSPLANGEEIESPVFVVDFLNKSEWCLYIYTRGKKSENHVGAYLKRIGDYPEAIGYSFTLCSITGKEIKRTIESHAFRDDFTAFGFPEFVGRGDIFHIGNGYLPNDTLTIKCELWKTVDTGGNRPMRVSELLNQTHLSVTVDHTLNFGTQFEFNQCTAVTRIEFEKKSIIWPIWRFSELRPEKKLSLSVPTSMNTAPSFSLTLYISKEIGAEQNVHIEIRANSNGRKGHYFVKCKMAALNVINGVLYEKEDEHLFDFDDGNDVWKFPKFIDIKKFNYRCCNSTLYLRCEFAFSGPKDVSHVKNDNSVPFSSEILFSNSNNSIGPMFKQLRNNDKYSDVFIRTGNHEFKAHKIVLSQSAVFSAMFENDMVEKQSATVDVKDIEKRILDLMLRFLYGEDLKIPSVEDAKKLYFAADKYQILPLKLLCSCFLKCNLCVSNIFSVLGFADLHQDEDLADQVKRFVRSHTSEVFNSPAWAEFMKSNSQLATDFMLNVLKNL